MSKYVLHDRRYASGIVRCVVQFINWTTVRAQNIHESSRIWTLHDTSESSPCDMVWHGLGTR